MPGAAGRHISVPGRKAVTPSKGLWFQWKLLQDLVHCVQFLSVRAHFFGKEVVKNVERIM